MKKEKKKNKRGIVKMEQISITLPAVYIKDMELLKELGFIPSVSEFIRTKTKKFCEEEIKRDKYLDPKIFFQVKSIHAKILKGEK